MKQTWNKCFLYDGTTIEQTIERTYKQIKVVECPSSNVYVEECSDIANGICKYKYQVWNYDLTPDVVFFESEITFLELFDYIKDTNLFPIGVSTKEYIMDCTKEALTDYVLTKRKDGIFYEPNN